MKTAGIIIILAFFSLMLLSCGGPVTTNTPENTTPSSFPPRQSGLNFVFKYGIGAKNIIDTFQNKFTKDMITAPSITVDFYLTDEDMDRIYQKMLEIDFFNYPEVFQVAAPGGTVQVVTPYPGYYFEVQKGSQTKKLRWEDQIRNPDPEADNLRELINLIIKIIESKPAYRELPEPEGGYL